MWAKREPSDRFKERLTLRVEGADEDVEHIFCG